MREFIMSCSSSSGVRSAKPFASRRAEAALGFVKQILRQNRFKRALQNVLARLAFHFQSRGKPIAYSIR